MEYLQCTVVNEGGLEAAAREMHAYLERAAGLLSEYEPSAYRTALVDCVPTSPSATAETNL